MKRILFDELRASVREGGAILRGSRSAIGKKGNGYVAVCRELDIASQGDTEVEAIANLEEALGLFLETADPSEIERRLSRPAAPPSPERPRRRTRAPRARRRRLQ